MEDRLMTGEEAEGIAIAAGALKPQGFKEEIAANWNSYSNYQNWADTGQAQDRLKAWTEAILNGVNPRDLRRVVG